MPPPEIYPSLYKILINAPGKVRRKSKTVPLQSDRLDPPGCRSIYRTLEIILIMSRVSVGQWERSHQRGYELCLISNHSSDHGSGILHGPCFWSIYSVWCTVLVLTLETRNSPAVGSHPPGSGSGSGSGPGCRVPRA